MLNVLEDLGLENTEIYQDAGWYMPSIHEIEERINLMGGKIMIQISEQRFLELLQAEDKLDALEACGVDNWSGYDYVYKYTTSEDELLNIVNRMSI